MAKISPVSIKYTIYAKFDAQGAVEKPDVIGALFGQTEGLLGNELEMRELQKEGKIGRVEVNLTTSDGKTTGEIEIPTALDKTETTLIAAALETIERIGPTDAKITIQRIDDVRGSKRDYILERAKKLLEGIEGDMPDMKEMQESVKLGAREAKIQEYGIEKLPSGDISGSEIIIVEGRADVVNLLRCGVNNVIGMNGTNLPTTLKDLSLDKEVTLFVDGDRGGKLIARNVIDNARVDYVAVAPDGKEVEELAGKEILIALRKKVPVSEFIRMLDNERQYSNGYNNYNRYNRFDNRDRGFRDNRGFNRGFRDNRDFRDNRNDFRRDNRWEQREPASEEVSQTKIEEKPQQAASPGKITDKDIDKLREIMKEIEGSKKAVLLNENLEEIKRVSATTVSRILMRNHAFAVLVDGTATPSIIRACEENQVKNVGAKNFGNVEETSVNLISL